MVRSPLSTTLSVILFLFITTAAFSQNTPPVVSNVHAEQETGTKIVKIRYDVMDADGDKLQIRAIVSIDGGSTFSFISGPVSGDYGSNITSGINKTMVWDASEDYPNQLDTLCLIKIIAADFNGGITGNIFNEGYGDYVMVPAGEFQMGDFRDWADGGYNRSQPVHSVYLDTFYLGKFEVTNKEYKKFIDEGGYTIVKQILFIAGEDTTQSYLNFKEPYVWYDSIWSGGGIDGNENYPVSGVSWFEALAYCKWLSGKTGHSYRLPSEAEWEKASRGTNEWLYPWGDYIDTTYANYGFGGSIIRLKPVGYYNGNNFTHDNSSPFGAYDMIGNVAEWCNDIAPNNWTNGSTCGCEYIDKYNTGCECYYNYCFNEGTVVNPTGVPEDDDNWEDIFCRGGEIGSGDWVCSDRGDNDRLKRRGGIGFRCVLGQVHEGENASNIFKLDTRLKVDFNQLQVGPSVSIIDIPANGSGYIYLNISSFGESVYYSDSIAFPMIISGTNEVPCEGKFLADGLFRVELPSSSLSSESAVCSFPDSIQIGDTLYYVNEPIPSFTAKKDPAVYSRSWDVLASRSAGISGSLGVGAGASLNAAKLSISGEAGMGLKIIKDHKGNILLDRRFEAGISTELEAPEANFVVGDINVGSAKITTKTLMGQSFQFSDLPISDTLQDMAQSAFILETVSFAGLGLSPFAGVVLLATIQTINALSDMYQVFLDGNVENYWGLGAEGGFGLGLDISVGDEMGYDVAEASFTGAMQAKYIDKHRTPPSKVTSYPGTKGDAGSGLELELAASYNIKALPFELELTDDIPLGSDNFSLFDNGEGGSITIGADRNKNSDFTAFSLGLKGGGHESILGKKESTYYNTKLEFGQEHMTTLMASSTSIGKFLSSTALIPLSPVMMSTDAAIAFHEVVDAVGQFPIKVTSAETRGTPFELSLGVEFDIAAGLGIGGSLGVTGKYLDELEYPRKVTHVYLAGYNYMLTSSEYRTEMQKDTLSNVLAELFSGTLPLIKTALQNFISITKKAVEAGKEFVVEVYNLAEKKVGSIVGSVTSLGNWVIASFSAETPRVNQKAFTALEVKRIYYSNNVYHRSLSKGNKEVLEEAETILFIVSEVMTIGFLPDGDTLTLDSLDSPVDLDMIIYGQKLLDNDFALDDKDKVKIYYYHTDSIGWISQGGTRNADTVTASIIKMGTYALGIELDISEDLTAPSISDKGTNPGLANDPVPEIYAYVHDDRFGSGIDLSESHLILNGDTLEIYFDPKDEKIFHQVSESGRLADGTHEVKVVAADFAGNITTESFTFTLEGTGTAIEDNQASGSPAIITKNFPNPFTGYTTITLRIQEQEDVEVNIYDARGTYVMQLLGGTLPPGEHSINWYGTNNNGNRVSPGIYFYQVKTGSQNVVRQIQFIER